MDGVLNFPFYYSMRRVFNEDFSMMYLKENLELQRESFPNIYWNAPFVDNHDQPRFFLQHSTLFNCKVSLSIQLYNFRFLALTHDLNMFKSALAINFFTEGIPIVYYGSEQAFDGPGDPDNRESLWPHFDQESEMFAFIRDTLDARRAVLDSIFDQPSSDLVCIL